MCKGPIAIYSNWTLFFLFKKTKTKNTPLHFCKGVLVFRLTHEHPFSAVSFPSDKPIAHRKQKQPYHCEK